MRYADQEFWGIDWFLAQALRIVAEYHPGMRKVR